MDYDKILDQIEKDFSDMPKRFRAFNNSEAIFDQLEVIRRQQIALAMDHIASEPVESLILDPEEKLDSAEAYKRNTERFARKQEKMNVIMDKLENLGQSIKVFQSLSTAHHTTSTSSPANNSFPFTQSPSSSAPKSMFGDAASKLLAEGSNTSGSIDRTKAENTEMKKEGDDGAENATTATSTPRLHVAAGSTSSAATTITGPKRIGDVASTSKSSSKSSLVSGSPKPVPSNLHRG